MTKKTLAAAALLLVLGCRVGPQPTEPDSRADRPPEAQARQVADSATAAPLHADPDR